MSTEAKKVMVIGGGIAGLTAAWKLSRQGISVELVEKSSFLGGHAVQLCCKAGKECLQCGACSVERMLKRVVNAPNIHIHLGAKLETVHQNGSFSVTLKPCLQEMDMEKQKDCDYDINPDECARVLGYSKHNAGLKPCPKAQSFEVDALILATGFQPFNAENKPTYHYGEVKNVITGLDLERIKRVKGSVLRPSDGAIPEKAAFVQCVGSRDERLGHLWCSHVCCPYALRTAQAMKYQHPNTDITIFYMDIQNTGKNFPDFYKKCKSEFHFIRTIPVDVYPIENERLRMHYLDEDKGLPTYGEFDLLVLSIGILPGTDNKALSELLGIERNANGFFLGKDRLNRTLTSKDGVFIAGTAEGPKNIAASMSHAGQAVCEVMKYLRVCDYD